MVPEGFTSIHFPISAESVARDTKMSVSELLERTTSIGGASEDGMSITVVEDVHTETFQLNAMFDLVIEI